ncbi:MAG: HAMP domain-containing histidine kinase [Spirochaetaceae bacterium]|nr:HAMP domain-containing histidine kinase [Spirochaetaceae bacterium]
MKSKNEHLNTEAIREKFFVVVGLVIAYALLVIMLMFLFNALREREDLKLQTEAEKSLNTIFFHLQDDPVRANNELQKNGIIGVGVYSNLGKNELMLGQIPKLLPSKYIVSMGRWDNVESAGTATYEKKNDTVIYVRYINRLSLLWNIIDDTSIDLNSFTNTPMSFPDVLYIELEGKAYHNTIVTLNIYIILAFLSLSAAFIFVYHIYVNNRGYRDTLEKQRSLVNLGQAARTLTHEIKNPLSSVNIQLAILRMKINPKYKPNLEVIQSEMDRVKVLTDKVSEFLYNPTGVPVKIDLKPFFIDLIGRFNSPVQLYMDEDFRISFDRDRARSVFENLIKNAIESGENPQVEVLISRGGKPKTVKIEVKDRGIGLPKGAKDKIYNPFYTTKNTGSGIGLSISRQFISARNGSIILYPREGGGTVAEVILPIATKY